MELLIAGWFVAGAIFAMLGGWISAQKNRSGGEGALLGFFFGPLGCIIAALLPTKEKARTGSPYAYGYDEPRRPPARQWANYTAETVEPDAMPDDWGKQVADKEKAAKKIRVEPENDGVDLGWLKQ